MKAALVVFTMLALVATAIPAEARHACAQTLPHVAYCNGHGTYQENMFFVFTEDANAHVGERHTNGIGYQGDHAFAGATVAGAYADAGAGCMSFDASENPRCDVLAGHVEAAALGQAEMVEAQRVTDEQGSSLCFFSTVVVGCADL